MASTPDMFPLIETPTFLADPDPNLICCICCEVFTNPQRTKCGHIFCLDCITDWLELDKRTCVTCREPLSFEDLQRDRILESLIGNLQCKCPNDACTWCGKFSRLPHHINECGEEQVCCPHSDFTCTFTGKRSQLNEHLSTCKFEKVKNVLYSQRDEARAAQKRARESEIRVTQLEAVIVQRSRRWLEDIRIDDKLDAKDCYGKWFEATVIGIPDELSLELHFDGWKEKHDERVSRDSGRLAPLHTYSYRRRKRRRTVRNWRNFEEGDMIDCQDSVKQWYEAVVVDVEEEKIFVHYEGWPTMWDEWIEKNSKRLAPIRTHSSSRSNNTTPAATPTASPYSSPPTSPNAYARRAPNTPV